MRGATDKDYYAVLGVARGATGQEIRKAYRRIAKATHPDINSGDQSMSARFKEATEAYETLSDPSKRGLYDSARVFAGMPFSIFSGGTPFGDIRVDVTPGFGFVYAKPQAYIARDIRVPVSIGLAEAYVGCRRKVLVDRKVFCRKCEGCGSTPTGRCPACSGVGYTTQRVECECGVPAGSRNGSAIEVPGAGNVDRSGEAGKVVMVLSYPPDDAASSVSMSMDGTLSKLVEVPWEEALRDPVLRVAVFPGGPQVDVSVDGSMPDMHRYVVKGRGMSGTDLVVRVKYVVPSGIGRGERLAIADAISAARAPAGVAAV